MKKLLSLTLAAALLFTLAACGAQPAASPNPPLILGEKYLTDLDYEQALLQFDQAIKVEPKNPRGYLGKADALLHLNRQNDAVQALDTGAKATRGEIRDALKLVQAEVAKSIVEGYIGLSTAYEKLGWKEIAIALLNRVCEELPEDSLLREALEKLAGKIEEEFKQSLIAEGKLIDEKKLPKVKKIEYHSGDGEISYQIFKYDENGQRISSAHRAADGTVVEEKANYDNNGNVSEVQSVSGDTQVKQTYRNTYNATGQLLRRDLVSWNQSNIVDASMSTIYEYNEIGLQTASTTTGEFTTRLENGQFRQEASTSKTTVTYNARGQIIKAETTAEEVYTYADNSPSHNTYTYYWTYEYNEDNTIAKLINFNGSYALYFY